MATRSQSSREPRSSTPAGPRHRARRPKTPPPKRPAPPPPKDKVPWRSRPPDAPPSPPPYPPPCAPPHGQTTDPPSGRNSDPPSGLTPTRPAPAPPKHRPAVAYQRSKSDNLIIDVRPDDDAKDENDNDSAERSVDDLLLRRGVNARAARHAPVCVCSPHTVTSQEPVVTSHRQSITARGPRVTSHGKEVRSHDKPVTSCGQDVTTEAHEVTSHGQEVKSQDKSVVSIDSCDPPEVRIVTSEGQVTTSQDYGMTSELCPDWPPGGEYASIDILRGEAPSSKWQRSARRSLDSLAGLPLTFPEDPYLKPSIPKPVVMDVKLIRRAKSFKDPGVTAPAVPLIRGNSHSTDDLDQMDVLDLYDLPFEYFINKDFRSSFIDQATLQRQAVCFNIGDVQTLLKHSRRSEEHEYSLPYTANQGDDTLRAVKLVTDKYDTFTRHKMRAMSFREGTLTALRQHRQRTMSASSPTKGSSSTSSSSSTRDPQMVPVETEEIVCMNSGLTRRDICRLEMFYRGNATNVTVCECLADVSVGPILFKEDEPQQWTHLLTGIPILVLDTGIGKRSRELHMVVAEKETGFPLWQNKISYLSNYTCVSPTEHTLRLTGSLSKAAQLRFMCQAAAEEYIKHFLQITVDPEDDLWSVSSDTPSRSKKSGAKLHFSKHKKGKKAKRPTKEDISMPCNFAHITRVDPRDSMSTVLPQANVAAGTPPLVRTCAIEIDPRRSSKKTPEVSRR